jgi:hypothetical protein
VIPQLLLALAAAPPALPAEERIYDPMTLSDREALALVLRRHVAHLVVEIDRDASGIASADTRDGFGAVIAPRRVAALCFVVEHPKSIAVEGPAGALPGKVILYDAERRVAIVETAAPLAKIGLEPAGSAAASSLAKDDVVFALVSTAGTPNIVYGWVMSYFEGHLETSLKLSFGMPVFDRRARLAGYARTVAWDKIQNLLVTSEMIAAARTATATAAGGKN